MMKMVFRRRSITYAELSKAGYQKEIKAVLNEAGGRRRFIPWNRMSAVIHELDLLFDQVEVGYQEQDYRQVFYISAAILEEMTKALDYVDDSSGQVGAQVFSALKLLEQLTENKIDEKLRKEIFKYYLSSFKKNKFSGWDWHLGILELAVKLAVTEGEADKILELLEGPFKDYEQEEADALKLQLLEAFKPNEVAVEFMQEHLDNRLIRKAEIKKALEKNDFERSLALANEGLQKDANTGYVKGWYECLLQIGMDQDNREMIILYGKKLLLEDDMPEQDYYQLLKEHVPSEAWTDFVEQLVEEIKAAPEWRRNGLIREILVKEEWWEKLYLPYP